MWTQTPNQFWGQPYPPPVVAPLMLSNTPQPRYFLFNPNPTQFLFPTVLITPPFSPPLLQMAANQKRRRPIISDEIGIDSQVDRVAIHRGRGSRTRIEARDFIIIEDRDGDDERVARGDDSVATRGRTEIRRPMGVREPKPLRRPQADLPLHRPQRDYYHSGRYAPIMPQFLAAFDQCAPGCKYIDWGVWGDRRHQMHRSCHNSGSAIDIHGIRCGGKKITAGSAGFSQFVRCMQGHSSLFIIFGRNPHRHHAHISLRSCEVGGRGKIRTR